MSGKLFDNENMDSGLGQSREHAQSDANAGERDSRERNGDVMALKSLLTDWGATSVSNLRWVFSSAVFRSYFRVGKLMKYPFVQREAAQSEIGECRAARSPERTKIYRI